MIGLIIGIIFGFLLQISGVTNYNIILGQLLLKEFTVLKVILSAVIVGMSGIYILKKFSYINLHPKPFYVRSIVIGGLIFGVGFGLLGYCPGTAAGAFGTGSIDAFFGIIGFILGSSIFASIYPKIKEKFMKKSYGNITIPEVLHVNPWFIIAIISAIILIIFYFI